MLALLLSLSLPAFADAPDKDNWKFSLDGYYRVRGYSFSDMFPGQVKAGNYMTHRLRLQPGLNFEDRAKFFMLVDAMDGVLWGDNESLASTALFAGDPSLTNTSGMAIDPLAVRRAWMEFKVPVGLLRVGRQGSNWGMGLLANEGNGFDDSFGENQYGSTYDRVIFATRPVTVVQKLANLPGKEVPLIIAVGVDRLVEDPLIQYYGYKCDPDTTDDDPRCEPTEDHSYTTERTDSMRDSAWWVDTQDDVWEMVYVARYSGDNTALPGGHVGDINAGVYMVNRRQQESNSNVLIWDVYAQMDISNIYFEGELLNIRGKTEAITLPGADNTAEGASPLYKEADIWGYVVRGGYSSPTFSATVEHGYASGDSNIADAKFTGRPIHPDYNVGLLLYEEILSRTTAAIWSEDARGLWSNGGVYSSRYVFPLVKYSFLPNWELSGAFLAAWPDKADGSRIRCSTDDPVPEGQDANRWKQKCTATSDMLGWEADFALKHRFHEHILFSLETGYAHVTDRVPLKSAGLNFTTDKDGHEVGNFFTVQSRIAYQF